MSHRGSVGSLIESHRANATRPDRRIFYPNRPASIRSFIFRAASPIRPERRQKGDQRESHRRRRRLRTHFDHPKRRRFGIAGHRSGQRPRPRRIHTGHLPAGSSRPARHADAASTTNPGEIIFARKVMKWRFFQNSVAAEVTRLKLKKIWSLLTSAATVSKRTQWKTLTIPGQP